MWQQQFYINSSTVWRWATRKIKGRNRNTEEKRWQGKGGYKKIWSEAKVTATVKKESTLKFCRLFKIPTVPASIHVPNSWILCLITPWENCFHRSLKSFLCPTVIAGNLKEGHNGAREGHEVRECLQKHWIVWVRSALMLQPFQRDPSNVIQSPNASGYICCFLSLQFLM